jgi:hypothetical protein
VTILNVPGTIWSIGRKFENLFAAQDAITEGLRALNERLRSLEDRVTHLEASQSQLITEARAAAVAASTAVAGGVISDIVTHVTRVEMRLGDGVARLPPADAGHPG